MKIRGRLIVILLVAVACGVFLFPTVKWYAFVPQETKDLATGSTVQIREYAQGQASKDLRELKELFKDSSSAAVPDSYGYLTDVAKVNYKNMKMDVPKKWTLETLFQGFATEKALYDAIEGNYRSLLLDLKNLSNKVLKLGLDLRGGMSILLEADAEAYTLRTGNDPGAAEVVALVEDDIANLNERIDQYGLSEPNIRMQGSD